MNRFRVLLDQQTIITPRIVLEVVAGEVLEWTTRRDARQRSKDSA